MFQNYPGISNDEVGRVITTTLEQAPRDATQWAIQSMAKQCGISSTTVNRTWKTFALQPHRFDTFKLSINLQFIEKVRDIVGFYLSPPERTVVLCVDEKSHTSGTESTRVDIATSSRPARTPFP